MTSTERLNQQLRDSLKAEEKIVCITPNPRGLPDRLVSAIISADRCPMCLGCLPMFIGFGNMDDWKCVDCGYDVLPWLVKSKAKHDRAWDHREG